VGFLIAEVVDASGRLNHIGKEDRERKQRGKREGLYGWTTLPCGTLSLREILSGRVGIIIATPGGALRISRRWEGKGCRMPRRQRGEAFIGALQRSVGDAYVVFTEFAHG
jgi:hypothetical protein